VGSPDFVVWLRRNSRSVSEELHQSTPFSLARPLFEEFSGSFDDADFFRHGNGDPLI
jgi:hypothetical protein